MQEQQAEQQGTSSIEVGITEQRAYRRAVEARVSGLAKERREEPGVTSRAAEVDRFAHQHPMATAVIAGAIGFLIGRFVIRMSGGNLPGDPTTQPPTDD
ncbi:DUF883 C-terminal domain-containing protein [Variovorax paradoxus]|uniref:DUF883 C-terminal domain-containing protein n=1 Tax=Variovorax paradoxus TaxID=34073 RepID=UPI003D6468FF